jgi:type I restriction enzyme, S subunit
MSDLEILAPHWPCRRARYLFREVNERGHDLPLASVTRDGGVEFRADLDIAVWNPGDDISHYKRVLPGDFVIGLRSFQSGLGCSPLEGLVSPAYSVLRPSRRDMHIGYFRHLLKSDVLVSRLENIAQGIRQGRTIAVDDFNELRLPLPAITTQRAIADYLDRETARIDALIAAKRRMVELLEEQLASHRDHLLVTDAQIRWIPLHHLTDPLRPIVYGIVQAGDEFPGGVPYIKTGDLPELDPLSLSRTSPQIDEAYRRARVFPGDIVVAMRASIGTAVHVPRTLSTANLTQGTARIASRKGVDGRWLLHAFHTRAVQEQCSVRAVGTTFKTLNIWDLRRIQIPTPDLASCAGLADQMDVLLAKHDRMAATLARQISLALERRQALITAAVTGQFDISEAA